MAKVRYRAAGRLAWMVPGVAGCWLSISCGGSGGPSNTVSGDVTTDRFEVAAGETMQVTGDLTVNATESISIAGDLLVADGASLTLATDGDLEVDGYIGGAPGQQSARQAGSTSTVTFLFYARNIRFRESPGGVRQFAVQGTPTADILIATADEGTVTVLRPLVAGDGQPSRLAGQPGQEGGSVEIATTDAQTAVAAAIGKAAFTPELVTLDVTGLPAGEPALLRGGRGGKGFTDTVGQRDDSARELVFTGTTGGRGGAVTIFADTIQFLPETAQNFLLGGDAGPGGDVDQFSGSETVGTAPVTPAPDGAAPGEAGYTVRAMTGDGGLGGTAGALDRNGSVGSGSAAGRTFARQGRSGANGALVRIAPGNGGDGGDGGDSIVLLGVPDYDALGAGGGVLAPEPTLPSPAQVTIALGGNGGASTRAGVPGGRAGFISILDRNRQPVAGTVTFINAHHGGNGFSGCGTTPELPGTNGGGFDTIPILSVAAVLGPLLTVTADVPSLRGGNGGSGDPPGSGGEPDVDDQARPFGRRGEDGGVCPSDPGNGSGGGGNDGGGTNTVPGVNVTVD